MWDETRIAVQKMPPNKAIKVNRAPLLEIGEKSVFFA
jgi:hypothetical protein